MALTFGLGTYTTTGYTGSIAGTTLTITASPNPAILQPGIILSVQVSQ